LIFSEKGLEKGGGVKIAIDGRWMLEDTGGIKRYTICLIKELLKIDKKNEYYLLLNKPLSGDLIPCALRFLFVSYGPFSFQNQLHLPLFLEKNRIDIFHSPNFMIPFIKRKYKVIITLHDLIPYLYPQLCFRSKKVKFLLFFKILLNLVVKKADIVITVSENSKRDILKVFPFAKKKLRVIYNGVEEEKVILKEGKWNELRFRFGIKDKFVLYVGRQDPSKNLIRLIEAFALLKKEIEGIQLVIVGRKDFRYPEPFKVVKKLGLEKDVIFTDTVKDTYLPYFYSHAAVFVFVSLYEGFGFPPLEAMKYGCPVVTSNVSSLPEVVGDAALKVNPYSVKEISDAIKKVLLDEELRKKLVVNGYNQVEKFTWDKTALKTIKVYRELSKEE